METKQIKEYVQNLKFGLKDISKTTEKYKNYKTTEWAQFVDNNKEEIDYYFENLAQNVNREVQQKLSYWDFDLSQKRYIRMLKTSVNSITYQLNTKFIQLLSESNQNTIKCFSILFYLRYYNLINAIMHSVLMQVVEDYPKNAVVKKMVGVTA